jgi:hypothetical protein
MVVDDLFEWMLYKESLDQIKVRTTQKAPNKSINYILTPTELRSYRLTPSFIVN